MLVPSRAGCCIGLRRLLKYAWHHRWCCSVGLLAVKRVTSPPAQAAQFLFLLCAACRVRLAAPKKIGGAGNSTWLIRISITCIEGTRRIAKLAANASAQRPVECQIAQGVHFQRIVSTLILKGIPVSSAGCCEKEDAPWSSQTYNASTHLPVGTSGHTVPDDGSYRA